MIEGILLAVLRSVEEQTEGSNRKEAFMRIMKKLKECFDEAKISYEVYNHPLAYTAQEIAQKQHFSGDHMAKVVMLIVDGNLAMAVVTASEKVHLPTAAHNLGATNVRLATEDEFMARFPGCEIGAMPPFGNLFGLPVYVDPAVGDSELIYFNGGTHVQTVRLRYADFRKLVKPRVIDLVEETRRKAA